MSKKTICLDKPDVSELGEYYSPDDCECVYLSQALIESCIDKLRIMQYNVKKHVIDVIREHERIHMERVLGKISKEKEKEIIDQLYESYRNKFYKWPQDEKEYREFYKLINGIDIL